MNSSMIATSTTLKNASYIAAFFATFFGQIGIVPETIAFLTLLMVLDVITGIIRTAMTVGPREIRSRTARKGIVAKLLLLISIFSIGITAKIIGYDASTYVEAAVIILSLGELYSIIGNVHSARTGKPKVEFDAISVILQRVKALIDKMAPLD